MHNILRYTYVYNCSYSRECLVKGVFMIKCTNVHPMWYGYSCACALALKLLKLPHLFLYNYTPSDTAVTISSFFCVMIFNDDSTVDKWILMSMYIAEHVQSTATNCRKFLPRRPLSTLYRPSCMYMWPKSPAISCSSLTDSAMYMLIKIYSPVVTK